MTIEELEIIVDASIEPAIKKIKKLMPQIKQQVTKAVEVAQNSMSNIDMRSVSNKIQQGMILVKKRINDLKKSNKSNEIAISINNKDAQKQISQIQKQIDSLQEKINARRMKLDIITPQIDKIVDDTRNSVIPDGISKNDKSMDTVVNNALSSNKDFTSLNSQAQKLYTEIEMYNKQLSEAKSKMAELGQQTSQTSTAQNKLSSFFGGFKQKIEQVKPNISNMKNTFKSLPKITQNITNNIKGMGKNLKQGIGHVLKYAGALVSLRGIYSALSSSAHSWLSSQNSGAKQLSANIEYLKYSMGSVFAPVIEYVINLVYQLMKAIQSVVYAFSGINIFAKATASSMSSTASSAKQASKSLSSVHSEINNVSENDSSGSGTVSPSFDLSQMDKMPNSIIDAIKNGNWYLIGETIGQKLNEAMESIPWSKIQDTAKNIGRKTAEFLNGFISKANWKDVGNTFAQGVNTIFYTGYEFVTTFDWKKFGLAISNIVNGLFENIDWKNAGQTLSKGILGLIESAKQAISNLNWFEVGEKIGQFIVNIDWGAIILGLIKNIGQSISGGIQMIIGFGKEIVEGLKKGIGIGISDVGTWLYDGLVKPIIDTFCRLFGIHSPSKVFEEFGKNMIAGLKNGLSNIWEDVSFIFTNLATKIGEKFTEIKANIWKWAENTKETVRNWADNTKTNISNGLNNAKTTITNWTNNVKTTWTTHWNNMASKVNSGLNTAKSYITNWGNTAKTTFNNMGKNAVTWGKDLVSNMASGIKNNINKVTSAVSSVADKIKSFLHFTEPDVGPLSNFHTYMPDMIDLMVQGIHSNMNKVTKELENLTATMSYTINTPDISPISISSNNIDKKTIQPRNIMAETLSDILADNDMNNSNDRPIYLTVTVGNKKLGEILLDDLRDRKRQTGKDIDALIGG